MRRIIPTILLLVAFAAQTFSRSVIVLDYYVNQSSFIKKCVNKQRPKLACKGKCQMMKKIQEEEKKDQQNPERKLENKNEVISFLSYFANVPDPYSNSHTTIQSFITTGCPVDRAYTIFHPPALA